MMNKHTPGPWSVAETRHNYDTVIRGPKGEPIALALIAGYTKQEGVSNTALLAARGEKDEAKRRELYWECQRLIHDDCGLVAPVWADFLDAASANVRHGEVASDWELDGARAAERWWFAA